MNGTADVDAEGPSDAILTPQAAPEPAQPVVQTDAIQDAPIPVKSEPSHLDAQEQRNKILADRQAKLRLWNDLKLTAFTRTITSLYCVVLLTLQTHIQLNLIGRFAYLTSVEALARESDDPEISQAFANSPARASTTTPNASISPSVGGSFIMDGIVYQIVSRAPSTDLSPLSVKAQLSMATSELCSTTRATSSSTTLPANRALSTSSQAGSAPTSSMFSSPTQLIKRSTSSSAQVPSTLTMLTTRSRPTTSFVHFSTRPRTLSSQRLWLHLGLCIDRVFETFFDSLNPTFGIQKSSKLDSSIQIEPLSALESRFQEITEEMQHGKRIRLASLFPLVSRQSQMAIRACQTNTSRL